MENKPPKESIDSLYTTPKSTIQNPVSDKMGYLGLLVRFALAYILCAIIAGVIINFTGLKQNSAFQIVILYIATIYPCTAFAKKNQRYLTKKERIKATLGFSAVNIAFQFMATLLVFAGLSKTLNLNAALVILIIPVVIHTPFIYFIIWSNMRRMVKRGEIPA